MDLDLTQEVPTGYLQWEAEQSQSKNQYQTCFVYLPLLNHPHPSIDKGYVQAGRIEMIIPYEQIGQPFDAPAEVTRKVNVKERNVQAAMRTSAMDGGRSEGEYLRTLNATMSTVLGRSEVQTAHYSRPRVIADYVVSDQAAWGGRILRSLDGMSPQEYINARLNDYLFIVTVADQRTGEKRKAVIPQVYSQRVGHFQRFLSAKDQRIAALAAELIASEDTARSAAIDYLNLRDEERGRGESLETSLKDRLCLNYLERKWAVEAANAVMQTQEERQQSLQQQILEGQKQQIASQQMIAEALKQLADRPVQIVTAPASEPPALPDQNKQVKSNKNT